jgi:hypothetical protein
MFDTEYEKKIIPYEYVGAEENENKVILNNETFKT